MLDPIFSWGYNDLLKGKPVPQQFSSMIQMMEVFADEETCINHLRSIRWKNGAFCPHCNSTRIYNFSDNKTNKCGDCCQKFSIKIGTIFEDSKIPLRKWFMAIWLITNTENGIGSTQLATHLKITQKSAWFMLRLLRRSIQTQSFSGSLKSSLEVNKISNSKNKCAPLFNRNLSEVL
jgi:transposase-like protein